MAIDTSLYNEDLAPIPLEKRTWGLYNYASLWVAMSVCIPTYMLASGLIAGGMAWWQAIGTILLGNLIVLIPMLLNAHAGTKYGIPFPGVRARFVRSARRERARRAASPGRVRMVRHSDLDRRPGDLRDVEYFVARAIGLGLGLFWIFLAAEHRGDLARDRNHQVFGRHRRAVHAARRAAAVVVGHEPGRRARAGSEHAEQIQNDGRVFAGFSFRR